MKRIRKFWIFRKIRKNFELANKIFELSGKENVEVEEKSQVE